METKQDPAPSVRNVGGFRQAIETKYHGPTNTRGSRISAKADPGTIYVPYDHALDIAENHAAAAHAYAHKYGWDKYSDYYGGGTREGYVFVAVPKQA